MPEYLQTIGAYGQPNNWTNAYGAGPSVAPPVMSTGAPAGLPGLNGQTWNGMSASSIAGFGAPNTGPGGVMGWLGKNGGAINSVFNGLSSLYGMYTANKQLGLMKDNLNFQKDSFHTNLVNSISSYNTALEDRIRGRTSNYEGKEADVQAYLASHNLKEPAKKKK